MTESDNVYDIIIIGAGPSGTIASMLLSGQGLRIALLEKSVFPRDKICGDALSADVVNQLYKIDEYLGENFVKNVKKQNSSGVTFIAPNKKKLEIPFLNPLTPNSGGFISKRLDFDNFLFDRAASKSDIEIHQNIRILEIVDQKEFISIRCADQHFKSKIVLGADGANSVVRKYLSKNKIERKHHSAGVRQYYENVKGFNDGKHIELHFYKELLPGYFWIFPLTENKANVGLGILSSTVAEKKINLRSKLKEIIESNPELRNRFSEAKPLEKVQGFGLPIGSKKRVISGNRYLLLGDAAALIDPFTGEGIGNAIRSARIATWHVQHCFKENKFDAKFNLNYDREIYKRMWNELRLGRSLQMLLKYPGLFNFIVNRAEKNESVRTLITSMLDDIDLKKELIKPSFYFKLFINN
ncbi:geranylgeranyl reductase family protein [Hyphobacterium sp. CCMP332]|nr:geranylgeranyl reductase family protein [Hyphobacterium sp. CCMP332]